MNWDISDEGWKNVEAYPFTEKLLVPGTSEKRDCLIGLVTMNINEGCLPLLSTVLRNTMMPIAQYHSSRSLFCLSVDLSKI